MSQENVELAKRFNEAWRQDAEAAFFQFVAEDVIATDFGESVDTPNVVHGRTALHDAYRQVAEILDDYHREVDEYAEVGGDWVIAVGRWIGTGKASGVPVDRRGTNAGRWREGKVVEWLFGLDSKEAALEAVESRDWAMSQENVEVVRELWALVGDDATELGDLTMIDPEVVYEDDLLPDHVGETYVGYEGLRRAWAGFAEPWTDFEVDLEWARGTGDEVVSSHRMRGTGRESGVEMQADYAYVWTFRDGRVVRIRSYGNTAEALEAAGLSE